MNLDLWNDSLPNQEGYERLDIVVHKLSWATHTDEWANSEEGRRHLAGLILNTRGPLLHEIKLIVAVCANRETHKRFRLFIQRDPCPVLFFGGVHCPICGGTHEQRRLVRALRGSACRSS